MVLTCSNLKNLDIINNMELKFKFKNQDTLHEISPKTLIKNCDKKKKKYTCYLNVHTSLNEDIILGEPFFKNYLVSFKIDTF